VVSEEGFDVLDKPKVFLHLQCGTICQEYSFAIYLCKARKVMKKNWWYIYIYTYLICCAKFNDAVQERNAYYSLKILEKWVVS